MMQALTTTPIVHPPLHGPITSGSVKQQHVLNFPAGLPGFEQCRNFVLMATDDDAPLHYLTAVDGPGATFLVVDPRQVQQGYKCELSETDARRLGVNTAIETPLVWLSLVTIEGDGTVTVNLRAPVVINPALMLGHQVIPHQGTYPVRHIIAQGE
jgi:flagellar assembly factor FliW